MCSNSHNEKCHFNILVFPGGSEIGLEIHRALAMCKEITLFSAGLDIPNHASFVFRRHFAVPSIHEPYWIEELNKIIDANAIHYVYPAYDDVIVALAQNMERIHARIVLPPPATCEITRSKSQTYQYFKGILPVPEICRPPVPDSDFPIFAKPDRGQGSEETFLLFNQQQLDVAVARDKTMLLMEYLPGEEVTVDCFSDREQGLLFCGGRLRLRTKSGISMASRPIEDPLFQTYAQAIQDHLEIYGAWFFQLKKDRTGNYKLLEIAPRIAGTMALHRVMGINFPLLSIYEQERIPVSILTNPGQVEIERALVSRFRHDYSYSAVYVDLDDTLVVHDAVNIGIMRLIYQCINQAVPAKLITKHAGDLAAVLKRFRLAGLFDDVIHLNPGDEKSDYIMEPDAILIDDSFSERKKASKNRSIRTFDSSMIDVLIDERI